MVKDKPACVYCGAADATTRDHVVASGLFVQAPAEGHITVPACEKCNRAYALDEEYFQAVLLAQGTETSAEANDVLRRWSRDNDSEKRRLAGLAKRLRAAVEPVDVHSAGGIYLRTASGVRLEVDRVNRVLEKIVRGLFFHEFGYRLPTDARVLTEIAPDMATLRQGPYPAALRLDPKRLGDVFTWRVFRLPDSKYATVWAMGFYDAVLAVAVTGPPAVKDPD